MHAQKVLKFCKIASNDEEAQLQKSIRSSRESLKLSNEFSGIKFGYGGIPGPSGWRYGGKELLLWGGSFWCWKRK